MPNDCTAPRHSVVYNAMYSLTAVGGIQYSTEEIMKQKQVAKKQRRSVMHFQMRENLFTDATTSSVLTVSTSGSGGAAGALCLTPQGLRTPVLATGVFGALTTVDPPHLKWLFSQSDNFGSYRVTRASLKIVGNVGSTATGTIGVMGFKDPADSSATIQLANVQGQYAKSFDIGSLANKEQSLSLPVDSTWKKVSSVLALPGQSQPFTGTNAMLVNVNSLGDLSFTSFSWIVVGGPATANICQFALDYEVEFREAEAVATNL